MLEHGAAVNRDSERLERVLVWRRLDQPGIEYCNLLSTENGWHLDGSVITVLASHPTRVRYDIRCEPRWATRSLELHLWLGGAKRELFISADEEQRWYVNGAEAQDLRGCRDVDLGITPCTNTLPIRRLQLAVGDGAEIAAAMITFPDLRVGRVRQRYTRLTENRYRYENVNSSYSTEIEVDELALVTSYAGGWERIAEV